MKLAKLAAALAAIMMMTVLAAPAVSAEDSVDLTATVLEPKPEIGIELNATALNFGSLYPGNTSEPQDLKVTNIGLKTVDVTATASDDGTEPLFVPGLLIDNVAYGGYSATLAADQSDDAQLALHVPDEYAARGAVSGGATFWAEEHSNTIAPSADFSATPRNGYAPLVVQFTDQSISMGNNLPTAWEWDFDSDGVVDSTEQNPTHTYSMPGTYSVSLTVSNSAGSNDEVKNDFITVYFQQDPADWSSFQHDNYLSGITGEAGPRTNDGSALFSTFTKSGGFSGIDVPPVIVDDVAYVFAQGSAFAIDKSTGEIIWSQVVGGGFTLSTPVVANGKMFVGTSNGIIAALDVATGAQLWVNSTGLDAGQVNTPIVYDAGNIYFGTWGGYTNGYYCFDENGNFVWSRTSDGHYWAGAVVVGNYLVFGGEDGHLVSVDKRIGEVVNDVDSDTIYGIDVQKIRSSLTYVQSTERLYFTSHAGYCYYIGFDPETGIFRGEDSAKGSIGYSTSTPAVYNGRVYVGTGQFSPDGGLTCLDAETLAPIWSYVAGGGVQASPVVSTYYDDGDGEVYIYFTTNLVNGGLHCLKDLAGNTAPIVQFVFTPEASKQQYTVQGVAISDGVVYYGNDKGYLFALAEPAPESDFVYSVGSTSVTIVGYTGPGGNVIIPSTIEGKPVAVIGDWAFSETAVTSVTIPSSVNRIGAGAFSGCTALTSVMIPNGVTRINEWAFSSCTALTSVTIPNSVTILGSKVFSYCTALTSVSIGSGTNVISHEEFDGCTALTAINVDANNVYYASIDGVLYNKAITTLKVCPQGKTSVIVPNSVTAIGDWAFNSCTDLNSITFEGNAPTVGSSWAWNVPSTMIVYYHTGATGFTDPWNGFTTVELSP